MIIFISVIYSSSIVSHNQSIISQKILLSICLWLSFLSVSVSPLLTIKLSYIFANIFRVYLVLQEGSVRWRCNFPPSLRLGATLTFSSLLTPQINIAHVFQQIKLHQCYVVCVKSAHGLPPHSTVSPRLNEDLWLRAVPQLRVYTPVHSVYGVHLYTLCTNEEICGFPNIFGLDATNSF